MYYVFVMSVSVISEVGAACGVMISETTGDRGNVERTTGQEGFSQKRKKIRPRGNNINKNISMFITPRCEKLYWITLSIIVISFAIILIIIPLVLSKIPPQSFPNTNDSLWEIAVESYHVRNFAQLNTTGISCGYGFVSNGYLCLPPCNWHPAGPSAFIAQRVILILIDLTGMILSLVSISFWMVPFIRYVIKNRELSLSEIDINLPRFSLFMLLLSVSILTLLYATLDIPEHRDIYCENVKSELGIYFSIVATHTEAGIEVYGALFHYFALTYLLWTVCSWLNIILVICFPMEITTNFKLKNFIFLTELLISILVPFLVVFLAINGTNSEGEYLAAYGPLQIYRIVILIDHNLYAILYEWPHFLSLGLILLFNVIIVFKLKMKLLRQKEITGRNQSIGGFETRFMIHSVILVMLHILVNATIIAYRFVGFRYFWQLEESIGCVSLLSNITFSFDGDVYEERNLDLMKIASGSFQDIEIEHCGDYFLKTESIYPSFLFMITTISLRVIWLSVFVVLIPQFSLTKMYKSVRGYMKISVSS